MVASLHVPRRQYTEFTRIKIETRTCIAVEKLLEHVPEWQDALRGGGCHLHENSLRSLADLIRDWLHEFEDIAVDICLLCHNLGRETYGVPIATYVHWLCKARLRNVAPLPLLVGGSLLIITNTWRRCHLLPDVGKCTRCER